MATYKVQSGDTLSGIAKKFDTTVDNIIKLNNWLKAGETIQVPAKKSNPSGIAGGAWIWYQNIVPTPKNGTNSVKIVQQALNYVVNAKLVVDGIWGSLTKAAYSKFQLTLWPGASTAPGGDADGNAGKTSLEALAKKAGFEVRYPEESPANSSSGVTASNYETQPEPTMDMTRTTWGGRTVNKRTAVLLSRAQSIFGRSFVLTQGSYNKGGVAASAGTHDGGGVVDVNVSGLTSAQRLALVQALRKAGFAAWLRTPAEGFSYHIHANAIGDREMASVAKNQVTSYFNGRNGLVSNARVTDPIHWPNWVDKYRK
jgi:LysM repeat protein